MATNLSALKINPIKNPSIPIWDVMDQMKITSTPVPYSPRSVSDPMQSAIDHGKELQYKIDNHEASQISSVTPMIDFSSAISGKDVSNQSQDIKIEPTGVNIEQPVEQNIQWKMSDDDIGKKIDSGEYDDLINKLSKDGYSPEEITRALKDELGSTPTGTPVPLEVPKDESMLDSFKFKSSDKFGVGENILDVGKFFVNLPADSAQVVSGLWDAVSSPIDTTIGLSKGIGLSAKGLADKAVYPIGNSILRGLGIKEISPTVEEKMVDAIGSTIKEQYGTPGKFKKAVVENPADTLLTLMGGLGAVSKIAEANNLIGVVDKINKVQKVINPVNILKQEAKLVTAPIKGAVKLTGEVLGKTTGTSGETIRKAVELGGTPEFKSALRGKTTTQDILANTKEGLQAIKDNRSKLYGEDYVKLQANKTPIKIDDIAQNFAKTLQDDYKIKMGDKGLDFSQSKITGGTSQSQIQSMFDDIQNWKDTTPEGLDVLKQRLQDYYRGTPDSSKGDRLSTIASNSVKDKIVQAVPEYVQMTGKFEKLTNEIRDITKTLSLNDKAQSQTAITKLNGVLRDNFPARQDMIKIIEEYTGKNLQGQIAGASLNAPLAKGLAGVISAGGIMTGQLANPAFWAGLAVASPRLIGEMASIIGTTTEKITQAINNIKKYVPTYTTSIGSALEGNIKKINPLSGLKKLKNK